jgi:hypothetical protein
MPKKNADIKKIGIRWLLNSRVSRTLVSLSKLTKYALRKSIADEKAKGNDDIIFAVVRTVTNDTKTIDVPEMKVFALKSLKKQEKESLLLKENILHLINLQ